MTLFRYLIALCNFKPLIACAVSRVFLNEHRRYAPRERALFAESRVAAYRVYEIVVSERDSSPFDVPAYHLDRMIDPRGLR